MFELAHFWHVDPATIEAKTISRFIQYERQAVRIAEQMRPDDGE